MASVKIVVTGPFGAGKTTLIRTISEITVLSTERDISDHTKVHKERTTVAMDFGRITIDPNLVLYLFGTPGQERFDFMWEILAEGMLGFIVVVDRAREDSFDEAQVILDAFKGFGATAPFVVAVNKHDPIDPAGEIEYVKQRLQLDERVSVIPMSALDRSSVKNVLLALLYAALESAEGEPAVASA
ncbi:MAG: ATP/GTP-binding protein [Actinobacteria bacterium]|nr:ATP/GTP-binding protein [Actinomycetota bacterium]